MATEVLNRISTDADESEEVSLLLGTIDRNRKSTCAASRRQKFLKKYTSCFWKGQWPVLYIIALTAIVNFLVEIPDESLETSNSTETITTMLSRATQGGVLLLYPFLGWLAEAYITYYRSIGCGLYLTFVSMLIACGLSILGLFLPEHINIVEGINWTSPPTILYWGSAGLALLCSFLGNAFFNANAIQMGTDQMLEASSDQLSSFVHWYYWATKVGYIPVYGIIVILKAMKEKNMFYVVSILTMTQTILAMFGIIIFHAAKKHFYIQPTRRNTIKTIFNVLRYAKKHKYPQRRSAMTYWEDFTPSRIDLGKEKYGGPFKAEEVEDTKSFLRIMLILVSLFGLYMVDNSSTLMESMMTQYNNNTHEEYYSTEQHHISYPMTIFITGNSEFVTDLILFLSIPLYQMVIKPSFSRYMPSMLKRFGLGLFCAILSSISSLLITILIETHHGQGICKLHFDNTPTDINTVLPLLVIPQVFLALAKLLIFLTGLEFILAQAPRKVQGLLIGIWYLIGIVKQINDSLDDTKYGKSCKMYIARCGGTLASTLLYCIMVYFYKYRSRGDIVDQYNLVADKVERRIFRAERQKQLTRNAHEASNEVNILISEEVTTVSNRTPSINASIVQNYD